ncbi:MAG: DUF975 family protein [Treponema sp.]|nr:DUF975 family protein [Treponema sp.]
MFDRITYKKNARKQLKGRWGLPILLVILIAAITSMVAMPSKVMDEATVLTETQYLAYSVLSLVSICIEGILTVAAAYVCLRMTQTTEKLQFNTFLTGLENWLSGVLGMLWYSLWVFLWSLLFIIPGIIKSIAYSQMFFILAENPGIGVRKAMQISKVITQGHKGDLFIMGLSFLGWLILCTLTLGIGLLWLCPYVELSFANAYLGLKNMAIMTNKISPADFAPAE